MPRNGGAPTMNAAPLVGLVLTALVLGCSPTARQAPGNADPTASPRPSRTLVSAHRYEPANMAPKVLGSNGPTTTTRLFNAVLTLFDNRGAPQPYLAESLPRLNTDTWRVLPDGRMGTTYRLRPNLTGHDGARSGEGR